MRPLSGEALKKAGFTQHKLALLCPAHNLHLVGAAADR